MIKGELCQCQPHIDYYDALSLLHDCDHVDIKQAFKDFCIKIDIENEDNKDILLKFRFIAEAYEILSNPIRRIIYDNFGSEGLIQQIPEPYGWAETFIYHGNPIQTYRNFFNSIKLSTKLLNEPENISLLELSKNEGKQLKEENITKNIYLSLEEVFHGGLKKINVRRRTLVNNNKNKTIFKDKMFNIHFKPGLQTGSTITFCNEGHEAPFTMPGDVIFTIHDRPHNRFQRDGTNLLMRVKVTLQDALLGTVIPINTIDDKTIRINITSVISTDYTKIVSNEGLPFPENFCKRGDLVISFKIEFPLYLTISNKNYIKQAFADTPTYTVKNKNEYIHRYILNNKMLQYEDHSILHPI